MPKDKEGLQNVTLILHDIRSVINVGAIFRSAEAFGVYEIVLSGYTPGPLDRFGRLRNDFAKASLGSENTISWQRLDNADDVFEYLVEGKHTLLALEQDDNSIDIRNFSTNEFSNKRIALVVGNETDGVDEVFLREAVAILEIPQFGEKESFNVASATAVALYAILAQ